MELHQIRYFLALSEELNFTRAAERCNVAQSSLTRAIRALETELGGPLFHRERARSHLSKLGQKVHPLLEQAHGHVERAKRQARDFLRLQSGMLRLGVMSTLPPRRIVELIDALQRREAGVTLQAMNGAPELLQERLICGELDAAIYALPALAADERFNHLPLYREPFVVVVHDAHPLARRGAIHGAALAGEPMLWRMHCGYEAAVRPILTRLGVSGPAFQSDHDDWILALAAAGAGFGFLPAGGAAHPGVTALRLTEPAVAREISLVTVRGRLESPALGALVHEAMRLRWSDGTAPAVVAPDSQALASGAAR